MKQMIFHGEVVPWEVLDKGTAIMQHQEGLHAYTPYPYVLNVSEDEITNYLNRLPQPGNFCSQADPLFPRFFTDPYYLRDKSIFIRITLPPGFLIPIPSP